MSTKSATKNSESILIFAGAGASKAVSKEFYPTTEDYINKLPKFVVENPIYEQAKRYLSKGKVDTVVIDIEEILGALTQLDNFSEGVTDPSRFVSWYLRRGGTPRNYNIESFIDEFKRTSGDVKGLISEINRQVYDLYRREPERSELEENWLLLLMELLKEERWLEVFTTNYDLVLEEALSILRSESHITTVTGQVGDVIRYFDIPTWRETPLVISNKGIRLTKLHGSVNWIRRVDGKIPISAPIYTGDHNNHLILYPGFKGSPNNEPFTSFHSHFVDVLNKADILLFIGFAFRDEYINTLLSSIRGKPKIHIIDPSPKLNLPFGTLKSYHQKNFFDRTAIGNFLGNLS
ncbi:MAG: SIR2 family protein [Chloroflexota bacterium]